MNITQKFITWNVNLCVGITPIGPTFHIFEVTDPVWLRIRSVIGVKHRGNYSGYGVQYGLRFGLRGPGATAADVTVATGVQTNTPTWIKGAKDAGNIEPAALHYASPNIMTSILISTPGWYRVEGWDNCGGSSAGPTLATGDSVVEVNDAGGAADPYNCTEYEIIAA